MTSTRLVMHQLLLLIVSMMHHQLVTILVGHCYHRLELVLLMRSELGRITLMEHLWLMMILLVGHQLATGIFLMVHHGLMMIPVVGNQVRMVIVLVEHCWPVVLVLVRL
jgi:hypothetical protein